MIKVCQESEMQFEEKKQQEREIKNVTQQEVNALRAKEKDNDDRFKKTSKEKDAIMGVHDD